MARPSLADITELEARLGSTFTDPSAVLTQAEARLADASEIVRAYAGKTWLTDDESALADDVPGAIPGVVASMVERATRNPGGITQETAGPFSRSFGSDAATRLFLTAAEKSVVRAAAGRLGIATLSTTRGPLETACLSDGYYVDAGGVGAPEETFAGITELMGGT